MGVERDQYKPEGGKMLDENDAAFDVTALLKKIQERIAGCSATIVDLATDADVVVTASAAYLLGYTVDVVMSAHDALIKDDTTTKFTIPASSTAGFDRDTRETIFEDGITVESDDAATGKVIIFWRSA